MHPPAKTYLARRQAEGKTRKEAMRALKRHLARIIFRILKQVSRRTQNRERIPTSTAPLLPCLT